MRLEFYMMKRSGVDSGTYISIGMIYVGQMKVPRGFKYRDFGTDLKKCSMFFRDINPYLNTYDDKWVYFSKSECTGFFEHLGQVYSSKKNSMTEENRLAINSLLLDYSGEGDYVLYEYTKDVEEDENKSKDVLMMRILK